MDGDGYREPRGAWTKDLAWVNAVDERVERLWTRTFGLGTTFEKVPDGSAKQRSGCDRIAYAPKSDEPGREMVTLEEKVRRIPFDKYGDVLFEVEHVFDDGRVEPGWAKKWPAADHFAWIWLGDDTCKCDWILTMPTGMLKRHFETVILPHLDNIPKRYWRETRKNNRGYKTVNLCLPAEKAVPAGLVRPSRILWESEA